LLIFFALGALVITWAFYLPLRQRTEGRFSDLQAAEREIDQLQQDLAAAQALSGQSEALETELDQAGAHIGLLKARLDVAAAQLALAQKDTAKARVALSQTSRTLDELAAGRDEDQRQVIADLKTRINLVRDEIGQNDFAAQSDLDVLAAGLLELESAVIR
jgi:chromosome segregation ATPase